MIYASLTNDELIRLVDNTQGASPLERELANRLDELSTEIAMLNATVAEHETTINRLETKIERPQDGHTDI